MHEEGDFMKPITGSKLGVFTVVIFILAVHAATILGDVLSDSTQLEQSLRKIADAEQLQQEIKKIGPECQKHEFLKEMVFDKTVTVEARIILAHVLGNYGSDRAFAKKILDLPRGTESDKLKEALLHGFLEPGAHLGKPFESIEKVAKNAEENMEARRAAITLLIRDVKMDEKSLQFSLAQGQPILPNVQHEVDRKRKILDTIITMATTPATLREMIERELPTPLDKLALMKQSLKTHQAVLKRAQDQAKVASLPPIKQYMVLMDVWSSEKDVFQSEMLLAMELLQVYAADHQGALPSSIPKHPDVTFMRGPYRYFKVGSTKDLAPDTIVLIAPKAHIFGDGKTVFVQSGADKVDIMDIADFNKAVASGSKTVRLAPSMAQMHPVLYAVKGDGHIVGYPRHMIKDVIARNNVQRKQATAPLLTDADALIEESFSGIQAIEMPRSQGHFPAASVER